MWSDRTEERLDSRLDPLNSSLGFDIRLVDEDIDGSLAWVEALAEAGVVTQEEGRILRGGLEGVREIFAQGDFEPAPEDEDIHTAVERLLTEVVGPPAGKLHTGRSRNDQVATDLRLWLMRACDRLEGELEDFSAAILESAERWLTAPMPGYTHLQHAQPVTWGHWMLAHFWAIQRDRARLARARAAAAVLPLGSGALAGTAYAVDRERIARRLGFSSVAPNSIDAVGDRDFALDFLFAASVLAVHISRLAEGLILFNSAEFGFIELDEAFATGSSLMPQKKNPDPLELARGKTGRMVGHLTGLLITLKGLPSAYDKDLQEDKEPVFDTADTLELLLPALTGLIRTLRIHPDRMSALITSASMATDLVDYLVQKGVPFREAHRAVGRAVRRAQEQGRSLSELGLADLQELSPAFDAKASEVFDLEASLACRKVSSGTAPSALREQLEAARRALSQDPSA